MRVHKSSTGLNLGVWAVWNLGSSGNEMVKIERGLGLKRLLFKIQRDRVDAPTLVSWDVVTLAGKDVAKVRITVSTADFGANSGSK